VFASGLVNLYTRDIEAGARFYGDLLGLTETFRTPREGVPSHVEFRAGDFTVGLRDPDGNLVEIVSKIS
jgi:lactoylglutathione lyase